MRRRLLLQRLAALYLLMGVTALVTAGLFEVIRREGEVSPPIVLAVAGSLSALLGVIAGFYATFAVRQRELAVREAGEWDAGTGASLLRAWSRFEGALRTEESVPLSDALRQQFESGALTEDDLADVRGILGLRNDLVHGGSRPRPQEADAAADRLDKLTDRLEARRGARK